MQVKVIKCDGSMEEYTHTKVLGSLNNALVLIEQANVYAAEQFAEAITFYFYNEKKASTVTSEEIHLMIQSVLTATGYENAAWALNDYRLTRRIRRNRLEVIDGETDRDEPRPQQWDKSVIVERLMNCEHMQRSLARTIASSVEEKVLNLNITRVSRALIRQLVHDETSTMLRAERQLQMAV